MRLYNSLSGKKEKLEKPKNRPLHLFVCGPTVYDSAHIGHARTYLVFDIFVRYLRARGQKIFYLQNITNVDDRIIDRAKRDNKKPQDLAKVFENKYRRDMKALKIISVNAYARATDFIPEIFAQIQRLIKKGYAYEIPGDGYYFDIGKFKDYGKLSHRTALQAEDAVSRIDESIKKKNRGDFALWKFVAKDSKTEPGWATPLGYGRPGWHIEDTAISEKYFGPQYDLHGGAQDLKFPHHEAEIAQQEAASGKKPFVKIWMHTGFLRINGEKMAKSLNNFVTIEDFLKEHSPDVLRWLVLSHHYRSPVNYTETLARQNQAALQKIEELLNKLDFVSRRTKKTGPTGIKEELAKAEKTFYEAMDDDLNTPKALSHLFDLALQYQNKVWQMNKNDAKQLKNYLAHVLQVLGLAPKKYDAPEKIKKIAENRELFRRNKQFVRADSLRKKALGLGYEIQDTPFGPWLKQTP